MTTRAQYAWKSLQQARDFAVSAAAMHSMSHVGTIVSSASKSTTGS
jgi:hypothetical protein